jgi:hypothetical protein
MIKMIMAVRVSAFEPDDRRMSTLAGADPANKRGETPGATTQSVLSRVRRSRW